MGWKVLKSAQIPHIMFFLAVKEEDYVMALLSHDIFDTRFGQCKAVACRFFFFSLSAWSFSRELSGHFDPVATISTTSADLHSCT